MRLNKWAVATVSAVALVGTIGGAVVAKTVQDAGAAANEIHAMAFGRMFSPGFFAKLHLTRDQRVQIRQILRDNRAGFVPLLADAHTTGMALRDAAAQGAGADELQPLAAKQATADTAVIAAVVETEAKVSAVLTPAQREKAAKMIDARIGQIRRNVEEGDGPAAERLISLGNRLNLTTDQKAQARQIIATACVTTRPITLQLLDKLARTEDAIAGGSYDTSSAQVDAAQAGDQLTTVVMTAATTRAQLLVLLTPEQKAHLKQL